MWHEHSYQKEKKVLELNNYIFITLICFLGYFFGVGVATSNAQELHLAVHSGVTAHDTLGTIEFSALFVVINLF